MKNGTGCFARPDEDDEYFQIRENSDTQLKLSEFDDEEVKWTLKPAR
ncbi:MAG: hypothetical protein P0Y53_23540 [Candidatus Pseudobacter hemicellulosilyticus]|uniref:Uncharacterized protein n=1 Tax=Candidatus Pseudobacter hemicellulosilyticus TaxID=3121375 RepID=A0AAJ5WR74_9BACT|nr:MAG: hypothetical protein P0Y53_23540 [Pseudobacter sp.]